MNVNRCLWEYGSNDIMSANIVVWEHVIYELNHSEHTSKIVGVTDKTQSSYPVYTPVDNYPVVEIDDFAFMGCKNFTRFDFIDGVNVGLPRTIKRIGKFAFAFCESLYDINYYNSANSELVEIGKYAFYGCKQFSGITNWAIKFPNATKVHKTAFLNTNIVNKRSI